MIDQVCGRLRHASAIATFRSWGKGVRFASFGTRRESDMDLAVLAPEATAEEWQDLCEALEQALVVFDLDLIRLGESTPRGLVDKISREGRDFFAP